MDMILLDWTRMGRTYCLAGAVPDREGFRIVRPLLWKFHDASVRNVGWSPHLLDGYERWEVFELVGEEPAAEQRPHVEDLWVRTLRPRNHVASREERRRILHATAARPGEPVFGERLTLTHASAYLPPGHGRRSLATLTVPAEAVAFSASLREGAHEPDVLASLRIPPLEDRLLPVTDHHLLVRAQREAKSLTELTQAVTRSVQQMGEQLAVRLGLSRPFQASAGRETRCWLMIDGFFSLTDPQP